MRSGYEADASLCGRGVRPLHGGFSQTNLSEQVSLTGMRHLCLMPQLRVLGF